MKWPVGKVKDSLPLKGENQQPQKQANMSKPNAYTPYNTTLITVTSGVMVRKALSRCISRTIICHGLTSNGSFTYFMGGAARLC